MRKHTEIPPLYWLFSERIRRYSQGQIQSQPLKNLCIEKRKYNQERIKPPDNRILSQGMAGCFKWRSESMYSWTQTDLIFPNCFNWHWISDVFLILRERNQSAVLFHSVLFLHRPEAQYGIKAFFTHTGTCVVNSHKHRFHIQVVPCDIIHHIPCMLFMVMVIFDTSVSWQLIVRFRKLPKFPFNFFLSFILLLRLS